MFALIRNRKTTRLDPAPSRWAWRMQRLWLTPGFIFALRVGVPFCLTLTAGTLYFSDETRRQAIVDLLADARASFEERPEFMVKLLAIDGAEGELAAEVRALMPFEFPQSSFDIDIAAFRDEIVGLPGVKTANVRIRPGGILQVDVTPRVPVAVWRHREGLSLVDESGAFVSNVATRGEVPHLPLIVGEGATKDVPEALALLRTVSSLGDRVRGVVRMGDRRWDVVLDRDQRILLPETGAQAALERVVAMERAEEVLTRDVARVDMRLAQRPTVQMTEHSVQTWWDIQTNSGN